MHKSKNNSFNCVFKYHSNKILKQDSFFFQKSIYIKTISYLNFASIVNASNIYSIQPIFVYFIKTNIFVSVLEFIQFNLRTLLFTIKIFPQKKWNLDNNIEKRMKTSINSKEQT